MRLKKIKQLSEKNEVTLKKLSELIGMTYQNLNRCIKTNKIQASDLEAISKILNVPVSYFFEDDNTKKIIGDNNIVNTGTQKNSNNSCAVNDENVLLLKQKIEFLEREIGMKDKMIEHLMNLNK